MAIKKELPYQPTSLSESNAVVIVGMAYENQHILHALSPHFSTYSGEDSIVLHNVRCSYRYQDKKKTYQGDEDHRKTERHDNEIQLRP